MHKNDLRNEYSDKIQRKIFLITLKKVIISHGNQ